MLPAKFSLIWPGSFRGEDLFNSSQSETRIALGSHICWPNGTKRRSLIEDFNRCFLPSLAPFGQAVSEENFNVKTSSPLKLLGQMEPTLAGSIYVRSSIKHLNLVPFGQQTWPLLLKIEHTVKS
jgi:hypothetical protein